MKIIIYPGHAIACVDGHLIASEAANRILCQHLKLGTAKKLIDTNETIMYKIEILNP